MRYWIHPTKLVNWRSRYRRESNVKVSSLPSSLAHCHRLHLSLMMFFCCCLLLTITWLDLTFWCSTDCSRTKPNFHHDFLSWCCFISYHLLSSHFLFSILSRSRCWWLAKVLSRSARHCKRQNAANSSNSIRSRAQFFSLLLWNNQFASAGLSLSQTGRCCIAMRSIHSTGFFLMNTHVTFFSAIVLQVMWLNVFFIIFWSNKQPKKLICHKKPVKTKRRKKSNMKNMSERTLTSPCFKAEHPQN